MSIQKVINKGKPVGEKVIRDMHKRYIKTEVKYNKLKYKLPSAIIVDLDGTLSLLNGRNPYDASTCEDDLINESLNHILEDIHHSNLNLFPEKTQIIFVSGRDSTYKKPTLRWLEKHGYRGFPLYMRLAGDHRKDVVVKKEIYEKYIKEQYEVICVFDDRD